MSKNVPKVRFSGFSGEWAIQRLGNFIEERSEKTEDKENFPLYSLTIENGVVPKTDRYEREFLVKKEGNFKKVYQNDFVYNPMNLRFGALAAYTGNIPVSVSGYYNVFNFITTNIGFWNNYLKTNRMFYLYNTIATGSLEEKKRVHYSQFKELNLRIPSEEEQEKIANFLTKVDKLIEKQDEKVSNLEQYKKGMMQKIFSQEIRFKNDDGGEFSEWEENKLGEIGFFKTSSVDKLVNEDEKLVKLVNYMDVYKHINLTNNTELSIVSAKDNQIEENNLIKGDILFTPSSETPEDIGHSSVIFDDLSNSVYSYHLIRFRPKISINILYSHYFCNVDKVRNQIVKLATGSTRFTVSLRSFEKILVELPCLEEQAKIANFLYNIDSIVEKEKEKLEELRKWKKGLLQGMFV